jgi:hypothetical protein
LLLEEEKKANYHYFQISDRNSLELSLRSGEPGKRLISYHLSAVLVSVVVDLDPDPLNFSDPHSGSGSKTGYNLSGISIRIFT